MIEAFKSTLESALNCDLALIVCDGQGEYSMQVETTLKTLQEMNFSAPYLTVVNKCEDLTDTTALPYGSVAISAKTGMGIDELKKEILKRFKNDFYFCELFIPYAETAKYAKIKQYLIERNSQFTDDGQTVYAVIPAMYAEIFTKYVIKRL